MINRFNNCKILLIGIGFYDYEDCIVKRLKDKGAKVTYFKDEPRHLRRVSGRLARYLGIYKWLMLCYESYVLSKCSAHNFDKILVIKGTGWTVNFFRKLRLQQSVAEFILYQWDALIRLPGIQAKFPFFDRILSFDRKDTIQYPKIRFRPLFFRECTLVKNKSITIDIAFVGWLHSDRLAIARKLQGEANHSNLNTFIYLYTGLCTWLYLALKGDAQNVHFRTLSYIKLLDIHARAKVIFDLPHALQSGLTMRTIEAVGAGNKLITTQRDIINYDFYSDKNICVIEANNININASFISEPAKKLPKAVLNKYSLDTWLLEVFDTELG